VDVSAEEEACGATVTATFLSFSLHANSRMTFVICLERTSEKINHCSLALSLDVCLLSRLGHPKGSEKLLVNTQNFPVPTSYSRKVFGINSNSVEYVV
jgi:hypothetical protein